MKKSLLILALASLCVACEQRVTPAGETTIVTPPAPEKNETNTTIVNPPAAVEKKTEINNTTVNPAPAPAPAPAPPQP